jgi:hypothetical protein
VLYDSSWRGGRVAEGNGLLNRRVAISRTPGSNPGLSVLRFATNGTAVLRVASNGMAVGS